MKKMGRPKGDNNKKIGYTIRMDEATLRRLNCIVKNRECLNLRLLERQLMHCHLKKIINE